MPAIDDDDRPKKKIQHEVGQDLSLLSVAELNARIALLRDEILRLEGDIAKKQSSRSAADQFFQEVMLAPQQATPAHKIRVASFMVFFRAAVYRSLCI
jgi:uncharacterized small protein (DUF1192 family)